MAVSAVDTPTQLIVTKNGAPGTAGTNGTDGTGFNNVRKALIDNPLSWLYKKNNIVNTLKNVLTVDRPATGNYTDIYGDAQVAPIDTPREEVEGWLITSTETHTFDLRDNVPLLDADFSCVMRIGSYTEGAVSQKVFTVTGTAGDLFSIGTDGSGNYLSTIRGSDNVEYLANTIIGATSASEHVLITTYETSTGILNFYIDDALAGTATIATGIVGPMDLTTSVTLAGNFTVNLHGLRFFDFILNTDEMTYLND